jgi:hypothetical protein
MAEQLARLGDLAASIADGRLLAAIAEPFSAPFVAWLLALCLVVALALLNDGGAQL